MLDAYNKCVWDIYILSYTLHENIKEHENFMYYRWVWYLFWLHAGCKKGTFDLNILTRCACVFPSSPSGCRNTLHAARNSARPLLTHQMHPFISVASNQKKLNTRWENRQQTGNTKTPQQSAMLDHHFTLTNNKYIVNQIIKYIVN